MQHQPGNGFTAPRRQRAYSPRRGILVQQRDERPPHLDLVRSWINRRQHPRHLPSRSLSYPSRAPVHIHRKAPTSTTRSARRTYYRRSAEFRNGHTSAICRRSRGHRLSPPGG
uniref:Uncharacterized protein n=1 Tax=uncultured marine virus TaxID=186617 RepID=A0A0F7L284_9VIRU|nr:hypothetical protein [uncultured marine virus]